MKTSASALAGTLAAHLLPAQQAQPHDPTPTPTPGPRTNWAGNYTFKAPHIDHPTSPAEVADLLRSRPSLKALGSKHSFNDIADSPSDQVSLEHLTEMALDPARSTVTVGAGISYGQLAPWLDARGFALHNLASLPHISVAGAVATGTHGSGSRKGNLATAVRALEFLDGSGTLVTLDRDRNPDIFAGAVVHLGALGIITRLTLDVVPAFSIAQTVYEDLPFSELEGNLDTIFASADSVSLFTDWQRSRVTQAWLKHRVSSSPAESALPETFFGATRQTRKLHPLPGHSAENCTEQLGLPGPWFDRLPHFRHEYTPSSGAEIQSEYFVAREHAYPAILAVEQLRDRISPLLFISELRTVAADDLWLSMAYQRDSLAFHFTWQPRAEAVLALLPEIEAALAPFDARPHWGKAFTTPPDRLRALYPRLPDFLALAQRHDPEGKLRNAYLNRNLYPA